MKNILFFFPDDNGVEVFESGAILLYLAQVHGPARDAKQLGADMSWVVWANSELDPLCFGKGMRYYMVGASINLLDDTFQIKVAFFLSFKYNSAFFACVCSI